MKALKALILTQRLDYFAKHKYSPNDWISEIQLLDDTLVHSFQFGLWTEQVRNELADPPQAGILVELGKTTGYVSRHR